MLFAQQYDAMPVIFTVRLKPDSYADEYGALAIERGLVLNCLTFDRLRAELESRRDPVVVVNLLSLR